MSDFDLAAASWRKDLQNDDAMLEALAARLSQALPTMVSVERNFALRNKNRKVQKLTVQFKDQHFFLKKDPSFGISAEIGKVVGNICLSREACAFNDWLTHLSQQLNVFLEQHTNKRHAIENFLLN